MSSTLSADRQHEARAEHAHLPAGVHQRGAVGHELLRGHEVIEFDLDLLHLRRRQAVPDLHGGNGPRHPVEHFLRRLKYPAVLIFLKVSGLQDLQPIFAQRQG